MASLQDQLLKAGLADKKSAKKIKQQKHKAKKLAQTQKVVVVDQAKLDAQAALAARQAKDAELAKEQAKTREAKEVLAQVKQLIDVNKQPRDKGDIVVNFTDANIVKRLYVNQATHQLITQARLAIAKLNDGYELIPVPVADKIATRHPEAIVYRADDVPEAEKTDAQDDEWYGDYEIPDDLMW